MRRLDTQRLTPKSLLTDILVVSSYTVVAYQIIMALQSISD